MAYFCALAGHETAKEARRRSRYLEAEVPVFAVVFTSVYETVVRLHDRDPNDDQVAYDTLRNLLTQNGPIPIPFNRRAYETTRFPNPTGVTIPEDHQHLAQYLGVFIGGIAASLQNGIEREETSIDEDEANPPPRPDRSAPERAMQLSDALASLRDVLTGPNSGSTESSEITFMFDNLIENVRPIEETVTSESEPQEEVAPSSTAAASFTSFGRDTLESVGRVFRHAFDVICPDHDIGTIVEGALTELTQKLPIAISVSAIGATTTPSSRRIGNRVHRIIQERYEAAEAGYSDIISEMFDPYARLPARAGQRRARRVGGPQICVIGPTTRGVRKNLLNCLNGRDDPDLFFQCLHTAYSWRFSASQRDGYTLRPDLINKRLRQLWEIKPIRRAAQGVVQEIEYRLIFNLTREILRCLRHRPLPRPLEAGNDIQGFTPFKLSPITVNLQPGVGLAVPFQVLPILSPLVLYVIFNPERDATLATLISYLLSEIQARLREEHARLREEERVRGRRGRGGGFAPPEIELGPSPFQGTLLMLMLLVILFMVIRPELLVVLLIVDVLTGDSLGLREALGDFSGRLAGLTPTLQLSTTAIEITLVPPPGQETRQPGQLIMEGLRIHGIPSDSIGPLWNCVFLIYPGLLQLFTTQLSQNIRAMQRTARGDVA